MDPEQMTWVTRSERRAQRVRSSALGSFIGALKKKANKKRKIKFCNERKDKEDSHRGSDEIDDRRLHNETCRGFGTAIWCRDKKARRRRGHNVMTRTRIKEAT